MKTQNVYCSRRQCTKSYPVSRLSYLSLIFHQLDVVFLDPVEVGENNSYLLDLRRNICKS